jgi:hypothetical protein
VNLDLLRQRFIDPILPGRRAAKRKSGEPRSMLAGFNGNRRFGVRQLCAQIVRVIPGRRMSRMSRTRQRAADYEYRRATQAVGREPAAVLCMGGC